MHRRINLSRCWALVSGISDRFPPSLACAVRTYPDVTPDAGVMAALLGAGKLPVDLQPAHAVCPQYVQKNIGWKKLSEQGRHD